MIKKQRDEKTNGKIYRQSEKHVYRKKNGQPGKRKKSSICQKNSYSFIKTTFNVKTAIIKMFQKPKNKVKILLEITICLRSI